MLCLLRKDAQNIAADKPGLSDRTPEATGADVPLSHNGGR